MLIVVFYSENEMLQLKSPVILQNTELVQVSVLLKGAGCENYIPTWGVIITFNLVLKFPFPGWGV